MSPAKLQAALQEAIGHHRAGRLERAAALYEQVRRAAPNLFDPTHLAGTVAYQQGRYTDAVPLLARAQRLDPRSAICAMRLGLALIGAGRAAEAEKQFLASNALQPTAEAWNGLGLARRALGRPAEAIAAWQEAVTLNPAWAEAHDRLGALIADTRGFDEARPYFERAIAADPRYAPAWCNLGLACAQTDAIPEAFTALDRALSLDPALLQARVGRALAFQKTNRIPEAIAEYAAVLEVQPTQFEARSARLLCLNYLDTVTPEFLVAEHRRFGELADPGTAPDRLPLLPPAGSRLRVAFLSPDLRAHSVAYFLEPLLRHLDSARFEIVLYHDHAMVDAVSARLGQLAAAWRNFASQPNAVVEERIRADAPHVLVDLAGHTGFNRLPLLARRLAPVQITYLGYPNTTGLRTMDFRFSDALADPPGAADAHHTETLVRFAPTAWCYQPPTQAPETTAPSRDAERPVVFGSFNNAAKISPTTLRLWTSALGAIPGSRLLVKGQGVDHPHFAHALRENFRQQGLHPERLILAGRTTGQQSHLAQYHGVDIALDTYPYHGTTTTCEALWMGRPVITLAGDRHASRVGVSLLNAIGHPEWIASSPDHFVHIAQDLAANVNERITLSKSLRAELSASPLLDHAGQARHFAAALEFCVNARRRP